MAREAKPNRTQIKQSFTNPPKAMDMRFYSEYEDPNDDFYWDPEKVLFGFTFYEDEDTDRSPAYEFLIEIENLDTGVVKNFVQLYNRPFYRFWQRQAELYTESPIGDEIDLTEEAIVNSRIVVTPTNDFGVGEKSTFILPFKDLVWTRSKDNVAHGTFSILNKNWNLFSEEPENRVNRPKTMYIYLDVSKENIVEDRIELNLPEWQFSSLTDYRTVNDRTYRWLVEDEGLSKLSQYGWHTGTEDEQTFIIDLIQTMLPSYRDFLTNNGLTLVTPHVFKMAVENPRDNRDTIIIYLMKGSRWRP